MSERARKNESTTSSSSQQRPALPSFLKSSWFVPLLLVVATLVAFAPSIGNEFVNYDDPDYVTSNSHVQGGFTLSNIAWAFTTGHASNWHPLTWLSHMFDYAIFGNRAGGHHAISVLLHIVNGVLLYAFLLQVTAATWRSAFVAGLFLLHPMHVESVAWASERKDVLSALFFFLTLLAYARYVSATNREVSWRGSKRRWYFATLCFFVLALLSKPMVVTLPFVLLLLDVWPLQRITRENGLAGSAKTLILEKLPFFLLSTASCVVTFFVQKKGGSVSSLATLSTFDRIATALIGYVRYVGKLFWPAKLAVLYPHPGHWPVWEVIAAAAVLVLVTAAVLLLMRQTPWLPVGWLWFVGILVPVIGLVQVGVQAIADRYTYLPSIGIFLAVTWTVASLLNRTRLAVELRAFAGVCVLFVCLLLTFRQTQYWRNSEVLFRRAAAVTDGNYLAYNNLGYYLSGREKVDEAIENYRKALEINPAYEDAHNNLGYALAQKKQYQEAIAHYQVALRIRPDHVEVHNNYGNALSELGQIEAAITNYQFVLSRNPKHADAHNNLGIALAMQGKLEEAIPHFERAIQYKAHYASAHSNLGNAYAAQRRFDEAIREYNESLGLKADDPQAHNNLANVLTEQGKLDDAIDHYLKALALSPINPEAHFNLAMAYLRQGKNAEAMEHLKKALAQKPDYTAARTQLDALERKP